MNRRSTRIPLLLSAIWLAAWLSAGACNYSSGYVLTGGSGDNPVGQTGTTGGSGGGSPSGTAGDTVSGGGTTDAGMGGVAGSGAAQGAGPGTGGAGCRFFCADDLQTLIDCDGKAVQKCPPDQSCNSNVCVPDPCAAAAKAGTSYGCDFWAFKTGLTPDATGACFAVAIANAWSAPVYLQVERGGQTLALDSAVVPKGQGAALAYEPYDPVNGLGVGQAALLFLARDAAGSLLDCPVPAAIAKEVGVSGTGRGTAFHITSSAPVVAYQIVPYGASTQLTSASLLLPSTSWDTAYLAVEPGKSAPIDKNALPFLDVAAREDDTHVSILPVADIAGGDGVDPAPKGTKVTYTLQKGEFLQIAQPDELTGSPVVADKPVAVFGGHTCLHTPVDQASCDASQEQLLPARALWPQQPVAPPRGRGGKDEMVPYRLVGTADDTALTWAPAMPDGAPGSLQRGQIAEFTTTGAFQVTSQDDGHPFVLQESMTSGALFSDKGDPESLAARATAHFLDHHVFFTDPTFSETSLVVVRPSPTALGVGAYDVTLDCKGSLTDWTPLADGHEFTRVNLVTGNFGKVGVCSNGWHQLASEYPVGVTVWGWGSDAALKPATTLVSYAYSAGAAARLVNSVSLSADPP